MDRLISSDLAVRLKSLSDVVRVNIIGQDEVLTEIVQLLQGAFCNLRFPNRPIASMLFLGPTGVGKTETALLFTNHLFGSSQKLVRLDMSEYMTLDSISVLRGANTSERGLFGHYYDRSGGFGTLLFDEIEKAHPLIMDVLLQILSAARFTLATGETLDLSNYIVVATSNVGARVLMESRSTDRDTIVHRILQAGVADFRVETLGRFELQAVFNKLDYQSLQKIAALHTEKCLRLINVQGHNIAIEPGVIEYVQRQGYNERFGARPMQNTALHALRSIVAPEMLENGGMPVAGKIHYDRKSNQLFLNSKGTDIE